MKWQEQMKGTMKTIEGTMKLMQEMLKTNRRNDKNKWMDKRSDKNKEQWSLLLLRTGPHRPSLNYAYDATYYFNSHHAQPVIIFWWKIFHVKIFSYSSHSCPLLTLPSQPYPPIMLDPTFTRPLLITSGFDLTTLFSKSMIIHFMPHMQIA